MKIAFIANDSLLYGSSKSMINLIVELNKLYKYDIFVILPKKGELESELKKRNIKYKIFRYYSWIYPQKDKKIVKNFVKKCLTIFSIIPLANWLKKNKIDIVHSNNSAVYVGSMASRLSKITHVWHIREFVEEDHHCKFFNKKRAIKEFNKANGIIYISNAVENKYKNLIIKPKSFMIYNGIPIEEYNNINIANLNNNFKITIVGNVSRTKGHKDAIYAIQELKNRNVNNVELLIVGDGVCKNEYEEYVRKNDLSDNITFLGFKNDLSEIRKQTHIALVCSKNEAFGRVTVEAMCAKNLVIGSNTGGTFELISNGQTGFLYKEGDYVDLADKIEYAIKNWNKCIQIIENAHEYAINNFNITTCAKKVNKVYEKLLGGK